MTESDKTNFNVSLNFDVTVGEDGVTPDIVVRDIAVTLKEDCYEYE